MSWRVESGVLDEGDSAGMLQDSFENHFRDMFLNVTYIKYITCTHSFKAALIAFLVTSWLNWPRHCMHVVISRFDMKWYRLQRASTCACIEEHALQAQYRFRARLTRASFDAEVKLERTSETSLVWCGRKDVLRLNKCTSYQEKKWQKLPLWVGWPTLGSAPALIALNIFNALNWKLIACVNALILTALIYIFIMTR